MFAVPGWSVSADNLKVEKEAPTRQASGTKKRKRVGQHEITASNIVDLYESVIEKRGESRELKTKKRKAKVRDEKQQQDSNETDSTGRKKKFAAKKQARKDEGVNQNPQKNRDGSQDKSGEDKVVKDKGSAIPPKPTNLTPLQASMREKLISARFRHLNETLYTRPSVEALHLFQQSPDMFDEYHEGFRRQVKVWPENPVDCFLADIRARAKIRSGRGQSNDASFSTSPLPRTAGTCTIADLGCGDARLAESLQAQKSKLKLDIKSYDLHSPNPLVTRADVANLPLEDASVNVAIFCLALMGTNWLDFIDEAYRILHWKGELWVAEIKSRFGPLRTHESSSSKPKGPVEHSVGNRRKAGGSRLKNGSRIQGDDTNADDDAAHTQDLAVEVDGVEDQRRQTDVSAFVEALRKRGFVLNGERKEAVNLSNRMFVKMHFIKAVIPSRGKNAKPQAPSSKGSKGFAPRQQEMDSESAGELNEASLLKPCVYKIR